MTTERSCAPALPVAFVALEMATRAALDAARGADAWDADARAAALAWVAKHRDQVAPVEGRLLSAEQQAGTWALKGDRDLAAFAGRVSRQGRGAGSASVGQAATLTAMPVVADALADGPVTTRHVAEITRATAASPTLAAELATPAGQAEVVELARRLDGSRFGTALKQMSAALDPASRQRSHDEQRAHRYLHIAHTAGGTLVKAQLDSVAGYQFAKAIDALNPRPAKDDHRDDGQRRADALVEMVGRTLADERTTPGSVAPVQAIVTMSAGTWAALRAGRDASKSAAGSPQRGSTADVIARLRGAAPAVDETGQTWPASEVARALCDCALTRAVVDADGQVLDLGRDERLFRRQNWVALLASGVTACAYPGCSMPLRYTELHHLSWWDAHHGPTNQSNCGAVLPLPPRLGPPPRHRRHAVARWRVRAPRPPRATHRHRRAVGWWRPARTFPRRRGREPSWRRVPARADWAGTDAHRHRR